jgi:CheY-like chemotaxis protein
MISRTDVRPNGANNRVLIVEDHIDAARGLGRLLRVLGFDVRLESDGLRAVQRAKEFRPFAVLIDLSLPTLDGFEVAERLRESEVTRDSLLLAMTGWVDDAHQVRATAAGFDRHLVKPLAMNVLLDALTSAHVQTR